MHPLTKPWLGLMALAIMAPQGTAAADATTILTIAEMHCALCAPAVTKALEQVHGVRTVTVLPTEQRAVVVADDAVKSETLVAAVARVGFSASIAAGR